MAESRNEPSGSVAFDPNGDVSAKSDPAVAAETSAPTQQQRTITKARKRTKTGCLTCRKRRIKCGEERPTCSNCIKSKRDCEGYTPRVIFKDPLGAYRPAGSSPNGGGYHLMPMHDRMDDHYGHMAPYTNNMATLAPLAPRPANNIGPSGHDGSTAGLQSVPHVYQGQPDWAAQMPEQYLGHEMPPPVLPLNTHLQHPHQVPIKAEDSFNHPSSGGPLGQYNIRHETTGSNDSGIDMTVPHSASSWSQSPDSALPLPNGQAGLSETPMMAGNGVLHWSQSAPQTPLSARPENGFAHFSTHDGPRHQETDDRSSILHQTQGNGFFTPASIASANWDPVAGHATGGGTLVPGQVGHEGPEYNCQRPNGEYSIPYPALSTRQTEEAPAEPEDDYWDVESDEEEGMLEAKDELVELYDRRHALGLAANYDARGFRSMTSYLEGPNGLSTYQPTFTASPLMDPQIARVFCHFVAVTAPTLSLGDRKIVNPNAIFSPTPVPKYQQALFTYTLPMLSLQDRGLLHAILAMSSLHMAKLQKTSQAPSLKHYHYALRRVAKALGNPSKRQNVATLAATLLLGFYEVSTAEHNKWNSHLAGARELINTIDFLGRTKRAKEYKKMQQVGSQGGYQNGISQGPQDFDNTQNSYDRYELNDFNIDENLISAIMGRHVRYDEYGSVSDGTEPLNPTKPMTPKEFEVFETQCDLFWWYAKQDAYQSIISGNRLLLPYDRWSNVQPRAPINRSDAIHGTLDHLILLAARVADFSGKDLQRKLRANPMGPPPGMQPPSNPNPPSTNGSQPPTPHAPPPFFGMVPSPQLSAPAAFQQFSHTMSPTRPASISSYATAPEDDTLASQTAAALAEWQSIHNAIDIFEASLGPDFDPLPTTHVTPMSTPFGSAIYYRTYVIACTWSFLLTVRIIATRCHPSMPAAAMVAAGVAAHLTKDWANQIGRITAGIQPADPYAPLNPSHGAALMDACMGIFYAGVQYTDAAQRGWTITKLRDVARLTGWQTSALIASGCERAWNRAAELGKGPPYVRTMNRNARDDRVAGRSRDDEYKGPPKDNNDRRFVHVNPGTRVYWAMGILSVEEDMEGLKI